MAGHKTETYVKERVRGQVPFSGVYKSDLFTRVRAARGEIEAALLELCAEGAIKLAGCTERPIYVRMHKLSMAATGARS